MNLTVREEYLAALKEGQKEQAQLTALGKDPEPAVLESAVTAGSVRTAVAQDPAK